MTERPGGFALNAPHASSRTQAPTAPGAGARGRGARSNFSGRYEAFVREAFDDGWTEQDAEAPRLATTILTDKSRSIIATNNSPDLSFDQSINPYRGCEHGCIYCYARPSHAYLGYSPGLDFESIIMAKPEAPALLQAHFNRPGYRPAPLVIGANTDAWQPVEQRLEHTRALLKVFARYRHPVIFITKSALILRDLDILGPMAADNLAKGAISITTLDRKLARQMEPRAAAPHRRLEAVRRLSQAGIPTTVMMAPIIPGLTDNEIEPLLKSAAEAGAANAAYVLLRLPLEIRDLFREWLAANRPDAARKVISLMRQMRGGQDYDPRWSTRGRGQGPLADLIARRFRQAIKRYGLSAPRAELDYSQFERPLGHAGQPSLF
ncbi:PA0069 family radical SAM protein [Maricaulis parjimensis]|uniref:PA0069 family radical SAM protein n=1 Tax=Maricaulis parjimensis TaxID=144023 RepID=UPI00193A074D|nr:PA0069 family radical SAM protein [Maricaulis parjimensis]